MEIHCRKGPLVRGLLGTSYTERKEESIGQSHLTYEELHTLVVEVEAIINSRPLTYVADDQDGVTECSSPSHLINGQTSS